MYTSYRHQFTLLYPFDLSKCIDVSLDKLQTYFSHKCLPMFLSNNFMHKWQIQNKISTTQKVPKAILIHSLSNGNIYQETPNIVDGPSEVNIYPSWQTYTVKEAEGSVGPINCSADQCKPSCTFKWNGPTSFNVNTEVLHLKNITRNKAGSYNCTASNKAWSATSVTINVIVECK